MNALRMNKYFNIDTLNPKNLDKDEYYFNLNWGTSEIKYNNGESYLIRTLKLTCCIRIINPIAIGQFVFFRDKNKHYNFVLGDYKVSSEHYTLDQARYFDLDLPVNPSFISFLKKEYDANIIKKKKRNKH